MTDLKALQSFITALGFGPEENIFFRLLKPKKFDTTNPVHLSLLPGVTYIREGEIVDRKTNLRWDQKTGIVYGYKDTVKSSNIIDYLTAQSELGMAVYIVVNPGGQDIKAITEARVLYYENDTASLDEQTTKFNELNDRWGGGFAVKTRNSIHCYFRLPNSITPKEFTKTQKRLIEFLPGSDNCIHDPSRVMRVPGFEHIQIDNNLVVRTPIEYIHEWDGSRTNWDLIDSDLPQIPEINTKVTLEVDRPTMPTPNPENFPSITCFLSIANREYIKHGVEIGSRNTIAKTLASDLIGTSRQLQSMGIPVCDTPEDLYEQYCDHCDTASPGELEGIWERTLKENPTACLDDEKIITNNKAFYNRNFSQSGLGFDRNVQPVANSIRPYQSYFSQELDYLDTENLKPSIVRWDAASQLWAKIKDRYPADVVKSIELNNKRLGIREYIYAMAYDCVVSGMCNGKYSVYINPTWSEPLNLFLTIVGIPGVNKSHIIKWLTGFLDEKNEEYRANYKAEKRQYKRELAEYNVRFKQDPDGAGDEPEEPELKYAAHGATTHAKLIEALGTQKNIFNSASNLVITDELTMIFGGDEKTGVNTKELAVYLSGFTGAAVTSGTKCDGIQGVSKVMMSIITTTQPTTLTTLAKKFSQDNGFIERFLTPIVEEKDIKKYDWHADYSVAKPMGSHICDLYNRFDALDPNNVITVSEDAKDVLNIVEEWAFEKKSLRAKPKSYIVRIASLYAIYEDYKNPVIKPEHVLSAWEMMKMDEINKIQLGFTKEPQSTTEEVIDKALKLIQEKGFITVSNLSSSIHALRSVSVDDRILVINKVKEILGNTAVLSTTTKGKPILTLTNDTDNIDIPEVETDKTNLDTVHHEGNQVYQNYPNDEHITLEQTLTECYQESVLVETKIEEVTLEQALTESYEKQESETSEYIYIPFSAIAHRYQDSYKADGIYRVLRSDEYYVTIDFDGDKEMRIHRKKLDNPNENT